MRRFARAAALATTLAATLALSGCIDADIGLDFTDPDTLLAQFDITLSRQLFDMTGGSFCTDGTETLTTDTARCTTERRVPMTEVLDNGTAALGGGEFSTDKGLLIEAIDDNRLRVSFDFAKMAQQDRPQDLQGMEGLMRAALDGHSFVFRVKAWRILSATGTVSADGKTAMRVIPVTAFLDQPPSVGGDFVTELQLRQVCRFWVFCD